MPSDFTDTTAGDRHYRGTSTTLQSSPVLFLVQARLQLGYLVSQSRLVRLGSGKTTHAQGRHGGRWREGGGGGRGGAGGESSRSQMLTPEGRAHGGNTRGDRLYSAPFRPSSSRCIPFRAISSHSYRPVPLRAVPSQLVPFHPKLCRFTIFRGTGAAPEQRKQRQKHQGDYVGTRGCTRAGNDRGTDSYIQVSQHASHRSKHIT